MNAFKDIDMFIDLEIAARNESKQIWGNKHKFTKMHDHRIGQLKNIKNCLLDYRTRIEIIKDKALQNGVEIYRISETIHNMLTSIRCAAEGW